MVERTLKDFLVEKPRWCAGCGNYNIIAALKKLSVDRRLAPHEVINVSGIGCSGRMPNYINTFGIHSIHGRPITVGFGLALARKEAKIFIHSGDGDALSIGGNHLLHGINRNFHCVFLLYDNQTYALTKNQASPTTPAGRKTLSHPSGVRMEPLNVIRMVLGIGASFVAATADWLPDHLSHTIEAAYEHTGFSFVHVLQRCVHYNPRGFNIDSPDWYSFIIHPDGIPPDKKYQNTAEQVTHDPGDLIKAFELAIGVKTHLGLFYRNPLKPCQDDMLREQTEQTAQKPRSGILDSYRF